MKWLFPRIFHRVQAGWHSETETTDYCRHNYCTFLHACPILSQKFGLSSRFWTADHRWWSNWFIKTISRRFISQETEQKWLVRLPSAKTVGCRKFFSIVSQWAGDCFPRPGPSTEHWGTMEISKHLTLDILCIILPGPWCIMMEYQFNILYLLSIWDKRSWTW